ncbi:gamma-glutamyl-gamma-aminobutyrate hydrolase family protein [Kaistia dalseonensis]|uniref:Glutamine amidotransferase n=1 Tax=Kaistia dalseonensis TaxID=410840 RepID=A0ABU0HD79_9HYPH|nr:gamma-glutamyl-gamma-aminobutyrate hydrolase family protein [Kaistia dalseonensis]MCX5496855.1 gamma-glutamyl-gamma-aminobutyrate hydrolase family protein [Kaistia dalseonensis]MDQ0439481.1 putative glutamine amidotransferase [Kaistia dalseonensis]
MTKTRPFSPLVAVTADVKDLDGYRWHAASETYLNAVTVGLGGIPVVVPSLGDALDIERLLDRVDGVLLTGSRSNVHPELYGAEADRRSEPYDTARDATSLPLIRAALARGIPLLAICRGFQELNVALGGTLISEVQELPGRHDHRAPVSDIQTERFAIRQDVAIVTGGCLGRIVDADAIKVNSLHRQAVGTLAEGLTVEAVAPDGTIEAVSVTDAPGFAVGVQWHPEYWVATDAPSARLFRAFGEAMRARAASHAGLAAAAE